MILAYYEILFIVSILLTLVYGYIWHKHFDINFTLVFAFIPVTNLGYLLTAYSKSVDAALIAKDIQYIGGCFEILFIMMSVFGLCNIKISKIFRLLFFVINTSVYISSLSFINSKLFYKSYSFEIRDGVGYLTNKEYGILHHLFYIVICVYLLITVSTIIYTYIKKKDVSRRVLNLLFLPEIISFIGFFGGKLITDKVEFIPLTFVFAQVMYLIIIYRVCLYDVTDTYLDSIVQTGSTGFISVDFKYNYLGSNETARNVINELSTLTVDKSIKVNEKMCKTIVKWIEAFEANQENNKFIYDKEDKKYLVSVNYLFNSNKKKGYQLYITDDTQNQKYIALINNYNNNLKDEVARKTKNIVKMHNNLILSMATMVESRDNSTGGHIKRTSKVVKILINEMKKDTRLNLSEQFCSNIIKAAPMHDLGKIAVDDNILRKPGRFTEEEFEKMKEHAAQGAKIVHDILKDTDNEEFKIIAENVAHYHHERWDGSGYPCGLKGEEIPIEARIMAIADVYDALVSKRVYKESMSFEQANNIIMEGMGKHFDKMLEPYYVAVRKELEDYYRQLN